VVTPAHPRLAPELSGGALALKAHMPLILITAVGTIAIPVAHKAPADAAARVTAEHVTGTREVGRLARGPRLVLATRAVAISVAEPTEWYALVVIAPATQFFQLNCNCS